MESVARESNDRRIDNPQQAAQTTQQPNETEALFTNSEQLDSQAAPEEPPSDGCSKHNELTTGSDGAGSKFEGESPKVLYELEIMYWPPKVGSTRWIIGSY